MIAAVLPGMAHHTEALITVVGVRHIHYTYLSSAPYIPEILSMHHAIFTGIDLSE
jgi:hypothetical protein